MGAFKHHASHKIQNPASGRYFMHCTLIANHLSVTSRAQDPMVSLGPQAWMLPSKKLHCVPSNSSQLIGYRSRTSTIIFCS